MGEGGCVVLDHPWLRGSTTILTEANSKENSSDVSVPQSIGRLISSEKCECIQLFWGHYCTHYETNGT